MKFLKISMIFLFFLSVLLAVNGENTNYLIENGTVKKYIKKGQTDTYRILILDDYSSEKVERILIDLMIFSGDVVLKYNDSNTNIHKYETANKIFLSISKENYKTGSYYFKHYDVEVTALKSSYYSIRYAPLINSETEFNKINEIPVNTNFLVTLYPFNSKGEFNIEPKRLLFKRSTNVPFMINFYSLNCVHKIYKVDSDTKQLLKSKNDFFIQDFNSRNSNYNENKNDFYYDVEISTIEQGTYNKKMCMVYVSSYEMNDNNYLYYDDFKKNILVGENIPQRAIFKGDELQKIKYLYEIPDISNDLAIKFILDEKAIYNVNIYISNSTSDYKSIKQITISTNNQEIIKSDSYQTFCSQDDECKLLVVISLSTKSNQKKELGLETTIKSISSKDKYPSYLIKNRINNEYLNFKSANYYYTDIGQKISGEIIINYYRGNGMIFGKIVKKNQKMEGNPGWKGLYEFPKQVEDTMNYNSYLKKLEFSDKDTAQCEDECYLLLNVVNINNSNSDVNEDSPKYFSFDILIITNSPSIQSSFPLISLPLEKYVVGSISNKINSIDNNRYYIINIPYDAQKIIFDLQSDNAAMYVNVYIKDNANFGQYKYPSNLYHFWGFYSKGKPQLFEITKEQIIQEIKNLRDSLEGISLTILIETNNIDNDLSSIYALKYHLVLSNSAPNIYEVYSDQQALCKSEKVEGSNTFRCLYMIKYSQNDAMYNLLLYPVLEDESKDYKMYANFIKREIYDMSDDFKTPIPNSGNSQFNSEKTREDFLYIDLNKHEEEYLFISIETDKSIIVKLMSTLSTFDYSSSPNPSTPQLYIINNKNMKFSFKNTDDIIINIVSILGGGDIYWEDEKSNNFTHRLGGRDDRLSLAAPLDLFNPNQKYKSMVIKNRNMASYDDSQIAGSFVFYLDFYLRSSKVNFDEFSLGKSFNLNYRHTFFPLTVYFRLDNATKDTNAFITLYNLDDNKRNLIKDKEFDIYATVISDNSLYKIKSNPELDIKKNSLIEGVYDSSKRVGLLSLKSDDFKDVTIPENESPNLVVRISLNKDEKKNYLYSYLTIQGTVIQGNSSIPVTEKAYQYGKLKNGSDKIIYKLNVNKAQNIMYFIFSSNSDLLDFEFSSNNNIKDIIQEFNDHKYVSNGRTISYFHSLPDKNNYLNLTIYKKNPNIDNENLTNYAFKYVNLDDISKIQLYKLDDPNITYTSKNNSQHTISINHIKCEKCSVTYFVNFILRESLIKNESFNNIAVIQSKQITAEFQSENLTQVNNKIILEVNGISQEEKDFAYIQVIAYINEEPITEYVAYNSLFFEKKNNSVVVDDSSDMNKKNDPNDTSNNGSNKKLIIIISVVSCLFVVVVAALVVVIWRFNMKNKNLLDQVNKISFVDERSTINEDENTNNLIIN